MDKFDDFQQSSLQISAEKLQKSCLIVTSLLHRLIKKLFENFYTALGFVEFGGNLFIPLSIVFLPSLLGAFKLVENGRCKKSKFALQ